MGIISISAVTFSREAKMLLGLFAHCRSKMLVKQNVCALVCLCMSTTIECTWQRQMCKILHSHHHSIGENCCLNDQSRLHS